MPNEGEFVIMRKWLNVIKLLSPVFHCSNISSKRKIRRNSEYIGGTYYSLDICIGFYFLNSDIKNNRLAPSICVAMYQDYLTGDIRFNGVQYVNCDGIPFLLLFKSTKSEPDYFDIQTKQKIHTNPLPLFSIER